MKKVLVIRHAEESMADKVASWMEQSGIQQEVFVPANGDKLPQDTSEYDALVIYGGVQSANDGEKHPYIAKEIALVADWATANRPVLGICLGAQILAKSLGGEVGPHPDERFEIGFNPVLPVPDSDGFMPDKNYFYQWHGEGFTIPENCQKLAGGEEFPNQAFRYREKAYGFQFHPEATREVMQEWMSYNEGKLEHRLGAHLPDRQLEDERRYSETMHNWLSEFLSGWFKTW